MTQLALVDDDPRIAPESTDLDELWTPRYVFDPLHAEFDFTVDACAISADAAKVPNFWTALDNGLRQSWAEHRVWCNPPYSNVAEWVDKADAEIRRRCRVVVMLLPATRSEQPFWQQFIEPFRDSKSERSFVEQPFTLETRFIAKRIAFEGPAANGGTGKFPSVLCIWRRA